MADISSSIDLLLLVLADLSTLGLLLGLILKILEVMLLLPLNTDFRGFNMVSRDIALSFLRLNLGYLK